MASIIDVIDIFMRLTSASLTKNRSVQTWTESGIS